MRHNPDWYFRPGEPHAAADMIGKPVASGAVVIESELVTWALAGHPRGSLQVAHGRHRRSWAVLPARIEGGLRNWPPTQWPGALVILRSMIHDGSQDQDLYNEQEGLPADAEALADFALVQSYLSTAAKWGISTLDALRDLFNGHAWIPPGLQPAG